MNKILLALIIVIPLNVFSQESSCEEKLEAQLLSKIKKYESKNLVPYYSEKDEKWGFLDKESKKKITVPIFMKPVFFGPWLSADHAFETRNNEDGCKIVLKGSKSNYDVRYVSEGDYGISRQLYNESFEEVTNNREMINNDISGFEVDEDGAITSYNGKYYDFNNNEPLIDRFAIQFKEKYYAVVNKHENFITTYSIIEQDGEVVEGFEKMRDRPRYKYTFATLEDLWFLIEVENNREGYVFRSINQKESPVKFASPYSMTIFPKTIGYAILRTKSGYGVLDLTTMKWKIEPATENVFYSLHYASSDILLDKNYPEHNVPEIPLEEIYENRKKSNIYVLNPKNQFQDLDLNLYIPKN
ncbi:hypothetical protein [Cellulophaga omnivescoria]|uniref:hypothetical protein n=1 Tax=Cellulophaga omnivescoria TaxID=1888890 RepID=UPI0009848DB5|nr:hypothetical protein [Cellulophaga omnivescoria]